MNKMKKFAMIAVCAMLLVCVTIGATVAYLTSQDEVTNTFTVGKVVITLDETDVDKMGVKDGEGRVQENDYHLLPGHEYTKDPIVHVAAGSEDCYVFVKVENEIADIEAAPTIATQITDKSWTPLEGVDDVYYKEHAKKETVEDMVVFENFAIKDETDNTTLANYAGKTVKVTAYAIQKDGFADVAAAWDEVKPAAPAAGE